MLGIGKYLERFEEFNDEENLPSGYVAFVDDTAKHS